MQSKALYWAPRILGILSIVFVSVFALDAFEEGLPLRESAIGFGIHLIPSVVLFCILIGAWRYERLGGTLFIVVALLPFFLLSNPFAVNALLSVPFLLTGVLFLTHAYCHSGAKKMPREEQQSAAQAKNNFQ